MKKIVLLTGTLLLLLGCETGVKNQQGTVKEVPSGIVDRSAITTTSYSKTSSSSMVKTTHQRIFSKSAQPGFYLQYAVFEKYRPDKNFLRPLENSSFNFIVLNKSNRDYVLIGPYKSYNEAHKREASVKKYLHKQTFVVQVLRP